jgi:CheY-like chemotaxis protein
MSGVLGKTRIDAPVRVVLSDDECPFRASLGQLFAVPPSVIKDVYGVDVGAGFEVVGEADSGEDTVRVVRSVQPDLLLLDLRMPRMSGLDAVRELTPIDNTLRTGGLKTTRQSGPRPGFQRDPLPFGRNPGHGHHSSV